MRKKIIVCVMQLLFVQLLARLFAAAHRNSADRII